jgi:hypothetical protein
VIPEIENAGLSRSALLPVVILSVIPAAETQTAQTQIVEVNIDVSKMATPTSKNELGMLMHFRRTRCRA